MAFQATFRHGEPLMIDYVPSANVAAGVVVLGGNTEGPSCLIAHRDLVNATTEAIAAGGGVYECISLENTANYKKVWWDDSANKLTTTSTNNAMFGFIVRGGSLGANTNVLAMHHPYP